MILSSGFVILLMRWVVDMCCYVWLWRGSLLLNCIVMITHVYVLFWDVHMLGEIWVNF